MNSVYLIEHQKAAFNKPPQYMPPNEIPSNQSTPRQPMSNDYPRNYSTIPNQMNGNINRDATYSIPPRNTIPANQRHNPSNYNQVRQSYPVYQNQQNTVNPTSYHRNSYTEPSIQSSAQSTPQYSNNLRTIQTSPRTPTQPASKPTSFDGIAIPNYRLDSNPVYSSHTQKTQPQQQPQPKPKQQPQSQQQSTQMNTSLYPSNQKTDLTSVSISSSNPSGSKAYIADSVSLHLSLHS